MEAAFAHPVSSLVGRGVAREHEVMRRFRSSTILNRLQLGRTEHSNIKTERIRKCRRLAYWLSNHFEMTRSHPPPYTINRPYQYQIA
ncbi:hypothetical protein JTE90_026031 [Oedothorax gibbosus]|uniref:Transposase IS204/IS1001/IS1096/IS1165 DDE domain-containing protein n=1 Tax=Oedothorax gibbosus TaxID=931172 RepID=A0AAV6TTY1_9ARAC|nr:hypothetical protein JTE90_026031 [Oedothorax gibbosus]